MARKKTNSQKARERRAAESPSTSQPRSTASDASSNEQTFVDDGSAMASRKRTTVLVLVGLGLLFVIGLFAAERWLRDDDPEATPTIEAAVSSPGTAIERDPDLSARCWPNGGPVPGMETGAAQPPTLALDPNVTYSAVLTTNYGSFTIEFYPDDAPNTVNNFVCLSNEGYYDDTIFHRVISGFMFQGGDPLGTGVGGPGYRFADEPITRDYTTGTVAMANAGANTNGSQFFVVLDNLTEAGRLPKNYVIFGNVTEGMETVTAIAAVPVGPNATGNETSAPLEPVELISVEIITTPIG